MASAARSDACVSLYVPTSPVTHNEWPNPIAFKDLAQEALSQLQETRADKRRAAAALRECLRRSPHVLVGPVWLAATLVRLGQHDEARTVAADVITRSLGKFTVARWPALALYRNPDHAHHMIEALRDARL